MGEQQMHASAGIAYADDVPHHGDLVMRSVGHHHRCLKNIVTQVVYLCSQSKGLNQIFRDGKRRSDTEMKAVWKSIGILQNNEFKTG